METEKSDKPVQDDVLHLGGSKLSQQEIDKALAHHKRHHAAEAAQQTAGKPGANKKQGQKSGK